MKHRRKSMMPRGKPTLTRAQIVDAALALVEQQGQAALNMRALAQQLGVGTMSVYYHFPNKEAVAEGVVERVLTVISLPRVPADADEAWMAVREIAVQIWQAEQRHPNIVPFLLANRITSVDALRPIDALLQALHIAGLSSRAASVAFRVVANYLAGTIFHDLHGTVDQPVATSRHDTSQRFLDLTTDALPFLHAAVREMSQVSAEEEFLLGLDLLIAGLRTQYPPA
jgi:AcrR family transcriptional regulator